jgi:DNA-binding protein HU-beta
MSNLSTLVTAVAATTALPKKDVEAVASTLFEQITKDLQSGEEVRINNFGTFKPQARAASVGRNPATGQQINIAAKTVVKFSPAKGLKDAVA